VLVRSDCITNLTPEGHEAMQAYGISTVIDLRSPSERAADSASVSRAKGVVYLHRPLVDDASMRKLGDATNMFGRYLMMLDKDQHAFRNVFNTMAAAEGGILFHCFAGKDRTGLIAAMLLSLAGVPRDHIALDFSETDKQLARKYEEWIAGTDPENRDQMREDLHCPPERILGVLDYLDQKWGGVPTYLETAGMTPANINRVSAKLT
jgi:protein-tyrosine phosphatase